MQREMLAWLSTVLEVRGEPVRLSSLKHSGMQAGSPDWLVLKPMRTVAHSHSAHMDPWPVLSARRLQRPEARRDPFPVKVEARQIGAVQKSATGSLQRDGPHRAIHRRECPTH